MTQPSIAIIGGTGPQGRGLAYRFAVAGYAVTIGSRDATRASGKAAEIAAKAGEVTIAGAENQRAAAGSDIVVLAMPYGGHADVLKGLGSTLDGKVVISCVNPLGFDAVGPYALDVPAGSAAEEAQSILPGARVVGAFHHVSALNLWKHEGLLKHEDVLVCGNDDEANAVVAELAKAVTGRAGIIAGGLSLARELEPWTGVLISINKRHRVRSGIQITGLESSAPGGSSV